MKPEKEITEEEIVPPVGDVIGNTAYSERFVLKILLKLANLDSLKDDLREKPFEEDLCTLWDMTAERDVVLFLLKHDVFNLLNFALPVIDSPRITEIIIGLVGNMCCHKEATTALLEMRSFLRALLEYIKTDNSLILVQLLRLVNSALFLADDESLFIWMEFFESLEYPEALYFMLMNSSNKVLLVTALENFNTVCSYFNSENIRTKFYTNFVTLSALQALTIACTEILINKKLLCARDELERVSVICLQIALNLVGFDKSIELYSDCMELVVVMINMILLYYEDKIITQKEMDPGLVDIIDCTNTLVKTLHLSGSNAPSMFFMPSYNMWKAINAVKTNKHVNNDFECDNDQEGILNEIKAPLSHLICEYILNCSETNLLPILDDTRHDFDSIVCDVEDKELVNKVSKRTSSYLIRLRENVDS